MMKMRRVKGDVLWRKLNTCEYGESGTLKERHEAL